jgi:hypothetical protein
LWLQKSMKTNLFLPLSFVAVLDPGSEIRDPGWVKIWIRDKHPGSATLVIKKNFLPRPYRGSHVGKDDDRENREGLTGRQSAPNPKYKTGS